MCVACLVVNGRMLRQPIPADCLRLRKALSYRRLEIESNLGMQIDSEEDPRIVSVLLLMLPKVLS